MLGALGVSAAPALARPDISVEQRPAPVSSVGQTVAWSSYDTATGTYRLMTLRDGSPTALPVAPSSKPFDLDLGTNRSGGAVAVYTRCDPGCDIYRFDYPSGKEQRLAKLSSPTADEVQPTVWRGEIAFVRVRKAGRRFVDELRIGTTRGSKGTRLLVSRRGRDSIVDPQLSLKQIAYTVTGPGPYGFGSRVVHVRTLRGGRDRAIYHANSGGASYADTTRPSWNARGDALFFARTNNGSGEGNRFIRYSPRSGRFSYAIGDRSAQFTSWIGPQRGLLVSVAYFEAGCHDNIDESDPSVCRVFETGPLSFTAGP